MPASVIKIPTKRFSGAFKLGNITNTTHSIMKMIGMAVLTRIGRGMSGLLRGKMETKLEKNRR